MCSVEHLLVSLLQSETGERQPGPIVVAEAATLSPPNAALSDGVSGGLPGSAIR